MKPFFSQLSYSFGNEDWKTELDALKLNSGDKVVCVTNSGDRPLHLLMSDAEEIISVDANLYQNQLLHLKSAALKALDYHHYLCFLGARRGDPPMFLYPKLIPHLPKDSVQFWNANLSFVSKGVLYQGAIEKWCQSLAFIMKTFRKRKMKQLFSFESIEDQRKFMNEQWDNSVWKAGFAIALHPLISRLFIKDPRFYSYIGENIRPSTYIREKINAGLHRHLAKDALLINLVLKGKVPENSLPPYLQQEESQMIKERLSHLKIRNQDVLSFLKATPDSSLDAFSLSDIASYLSEKDFILLTNEILRTAKPGARFCVRQFMSNYQIPAELSSHFARDAELEKRLEEEDRCFVYRFTVGTIQK